MREPGLIAYCLHGLSSIITKLYLNTYHRLEIVGRENIPHAPPYVIIANHTSHLDAAVLSTLAPLHWHDRVFPVAAEDTFHHSWMMKLFAAGVINAIPIDREKVEHQYLIDLRHKLTEQAAILILFPEGTRTRTGDIGFFKPGIGSIVRGLDIPILPCHLDGTFQALPAGQHWPKPVKIKVCIGKPMTFRDVEKGKSGREKITEELRNAVFDLSKRREDR